MLYDMIAPSENMNIPATQIKDMVREQMEEIYQNEQDNEMRRVAAIQREQDALTEQYNDYYTTQYNAVNKRAKFLEDAKIGFVSAPLIKLFKESLDFKPNKRDEVVMKNLVTKFVTEQGAGELLNRFKYQNTLTAEIGRIATKAYDALIESLDNNNEPDESTIPGRAKELKLNKTVVDDFYKDIIDLDVDEASKLIRDKVSDAMSDFVDQNIQTKAEYEEIINVAKEKIQDLKDQDADKAEEGNLTSADSTATEEATAYIKNEMERQIHEMKRTRPKNVFHYMVEAIIKESFLDENLKTRYMHEGAIDVDSVTHSAQLIYTMLEMVNTTEMIDESYVQQYIKSLTEI